MTIDDNLSNASLIEATRDRSSFSGHGNSKGSAGYRVEADNPDCEFLSSSGQTTIINPRDGGFGKITIGAAWDNIQLQNTGLINKLLKKVSGKGVDIDLGCMYELQDGSRGAIQAFGGLHGNYDSSPFLSLSGDERTGNKDGYDEHIELNGQHWPELKRLLVYVYIYHGAHNWSIIKPQIHVTITGETPMIVTPDVHHDELAVCAIAMIENKSNGIRITNHTEYFPGHPEMDRAFGFGLDWDDGSK